MFRRHWNAIRDWWSRQVGRERVAMFLELAIFAATLSYVVVASRQLGVMRDTLRQQQQLIDQNRNLVAAAQSQASAAAVQAKAAKSEAETSRALVDTAKQQNQIAAEAAKAQTGTNKELVEQAKTSNRTSEQTLRISQRADVEVVRMQCAYYLADPLREPKPTILTLTTEIAPVFKNVGKSTAMDFRSVMAVPKPYAPAPDLRPFLVQVPASRLGPGEEAQGRAIPLNRGAAPTQEILNRFISGTLPLEFWGNFSYRDDFGPSNGVFGFRYTPGTGCDFTILEEK